MSNEHNNAPAVPDTHISVQEAWEAAGGNPGIKASKADLIIALKTLDTVCDEADAAPAVPQGAIGWIPKWAFARLTGELGGKADPVTWGLHAPIYAKEPGAGDGVAIYATPAPAPTPAQEAPSDPNGWCQYVAGMVFCWLQMQEGLGLTSYDEDRFVEAIAGIVQRRLWAYKPAQEVSDKHEREMLEVIDERDRINEWADQLADAIAKHTGYEIGEHTSANNPWRMALNALVCHEAKQEVGLTDEVPAHVAGLLEQRRELDAIEFFESTNRDSYGFKKSVRGTYVNPAVARDWKWFQLGMKHATEDES